MTTKLPSPSVVAGRHVARLTLVDFVRRWGSEVSHIEGPEGVRIAPVTPENIDWGMVLFDWSRVPSEMRSGSSWESRVASVRFRENISVDPGYKRSWRYDESDILNAEVLTGQKLQKFSWNPATGEFVLISPGQNHATGKMRAPFDDYVRGIVLPKQKTVAFRPFWPTWMQKRTSSFADEEAREVSFAAQIAAQFALMKHGAKDWTFRKDITNRGLEEMTGRWRW